MAVLKWKDVGEWVTLYSASIKNKLRRDLNLADLVDKVEALSNLNLIGDISDTTDPDEPTDKHCHDTRYKAMINQAKTEVINQVQTIGIQVTGDTYSTKVYPNSSGTYQVDISNVKASTLYVKAGTGKSLIMTAPGSGEQYASVSSGCFADNLGRLYSTNLTVSNEAAANTVRATKVYGAVWNDYAEYFPKGEEVEPGDLIQLDFNSDEEKYVRLKNERSGVVGVCSDEYSHIIGGEEPPEGEDFKAWNDKKYIPVALAGRVHVNVIGPAIKGEYLVPDADGCARAYIRGVDDPAMIIGMLVEDDKMIGKRKLKMKIK